MGRPLIPAEADIPSHIWEWRNRCLSIDTHSTSAIFAVRICGYMALVKTGRERQLPVPARPRYVTLLSVVLALALTAALAACGSDEPSGGAGPDRTASTPTETPASPARTPSTPGSGDAPTATDTPVPATPTAPPAASGPAETDREALVALYNAADGENWNRSDNWLSDAPLGEWEGVTTNDDGRVTKLLFIGNNIGGELPAELGSLSNLTHLLLGGGGLSGELPAELGSLSNLRTLELAGNYQLSGCVPSSLEDRLVVSYFGDLVAFC